MQDKELINFVKKGPKYRPPSKINWNNCRNVIHDSLQNYCKNWIKREHVGKKSLDSFFNAIMKIVDIRIRHFEQHFRHDNNNKYTISRIKKKLTEFGKEFVFVPADKAANNIIIVCRKHYIEVLQKEITSSQTFQLTQLTENEITNKHLLTATSLQAKPDSKTVPTMYWIPKLHKTPYKSRFISSSSHCSTTKVSIILTNTLTAIKNLVINVCNKVYENSGINHFWSVKNSLEVLDKLQAYNGPFESLESFDFSTLYTTLPHNLIKDKFRRLIQWAFKKSDCEYICSNSFKTYFSNSKQKKAVNWTSFDMITALEFLLDNIFIRFGNTVYRQVIGIPMGTNCAPLIADLFLYCYESQFMTNISKDPSKYHLIEKFNNTFRYLDDILSLNNDDFNTYCKDIYPKELTLNKANSNNHHCPFLDINFNINNDKLDTKIYDKRDDFSFPIVNYPFLDGDVPLAPSYGVYISQLVRFARVCNNVNDFNERNLVITEKLLHQGFRFHKLVKTFTKFYYRYRDLVHKYNATCKHLIKAGISHPLFYGNVLHKGKKCFHSPNKLIKPLNRLIHKGYNYGIVVKSLRMVFFGINIDFLIGSLHLN